jgi:hypothetical protein
MWFGYVWVTRRGPGAVRSRKMTKKSEKLKSPCGPAPTTESVFIFYEILLYHFQEEVISFQIICRLAMFGSCRAPGAVRSRKMTKKGKNVKFPSGPVRATESIFIFYKILLCHFQEEVISFQIICGLAMFGSHAAALEQRATERGGGPHIYHPQTGLQTARRGLKRNLWHTLIVPRATEN